jgi:flagellar motor switch/type III secretory pathway protein FliN
VIRTLRFGAPRRLEDGRMLREPAFAPRSTLSLTSACALANGVCEQLRRLLSAQVDVEVIEPAVPGVEARRTLFAGARVTRVHGTFSDAYLIVRQPDARRLVALAFGEVQRPDGVPLSEIESRVLDRIVAAVLPLCAQLCGPLGDVSRAPAELAMRECATYLELRTAALPYAAIGFALTRDPPEHVGPSLRPADLHDVPIEVRVELARGSISLGALGALRSGATVALSTALDDPGVLRIAGRAVAYGTCGIRQGRCAFSVGTAAIEATAA